MILIGKRSNIILDSFTDEGEEFGGEIELNQVFDEKEPEIIHKSEVAKFDSSWLDG